MLRLISAIYMSAAVGFAPAFSQSITVPNAPQLKEHVLNTYKIAIKTPRSWRTVKASNNEIFAATGRLGQVESTCLIRLTSVAELKSQSSKAFIDVMTKDKFVELASVTGARPEVHLFDSAYLGGTVARRIIHTQPFEGVPLTYLSHQALRDGDIFTVACYARQPDFASVANTFGMIIGTTRFIP